MGVAQHFYARFAEWLASRGYRAVTFDYRGIGLSAPRSLRGFRIDLFDWAREDCAAVISFVKNADSNLPLYWVGRKLGKERLERLAERHGRWLTVSPEDIGRADDWFSRHGRKAMFLGRLVPGVRSLIAIPAGLHEMPMAPFLIFTMLGSALWSAALAGAGYQLGAQFREVEKYLDPVSWIVFGGGFLWYIWRVVRQGRDRRAS